MGSTSTQAIEELSHLPDCVSIGLYGRIDGNNNCDCGRWLMDIENVFGKKLNYEILQGDNRKLMQSLPEKSVHCVVTSPPYMGLRDYQLPKSHWESIDYSPVPGAPPCFSIPEMDCCLGLEASPEAFIGHLVLVFRDVWRVLRDDGSVWLNLGDSYAANRPGGQPPPTNTGNRSGYLQSGSQGIMSIPDGLKPKDLMMIPHRVALALQADGWYVRQDIVWAKGFSGDIREGNTMPESVEDRCTKAHEYIFLLSKKRTYYFDNEAIKETAKDWGTRDRSEFRGGTNDPMLKHHGLDKCNHEMGNRRSVWRINPVAYKGAHFATFPPELVETCILAGTSEKGVCPNCGSQWVRVVKDDGKAIIPRYPSSEIIRETKMNGPASWSIKSTVGWRQSCKCESHETIPATVLDLYSGSGTTVATALKNNRNGIGLELNQEYVELSHERIAETLKNMVRKPIRKKQEQNELLPLFAQ